MPSVSELTRGVEPFLVGPRAGPGVCRACFNLVDGYERCWACAHGGRWLDAFVPVSYSVSGGPLHAMLAAYKRTRGPEAHAFEIRLAAILWRYLELHEGCIAAAASVRAFDLVTTVPSGARQRDAEHPLQRMVSRRVGPVRERHRRLLERTDVPSRPHEFDAERFRASEGINGASVLLIDDTWTTGASAQGAAAALKTAGASTVAAVVIGRYLTIGWHENRERLQALPRPFRWDRCALDEEGSKTRVA
jgi:predicted amidophosphoribosyltransferase